MSLFDEFISNEFGLLLVITLVVWGGFFSYLTYILSKVRDLRDEVRSLVKMSAETNGTED